MSRLEQLRERIRKLDEDILGLIAERMETAKAIGQEKKEDGIPLRDWNVERQVLDRARRQAQAFDLSPQVVRSVMQTLITAARAEQERTSYSTYRGTAERILIIGGRGKMGRWFADFFGNQGHDVRVYDTAADCHPERVRRRRANRGIRPRIRRCFRCGARFLRATCRSRSE